MVLTIYLCHLKFFFQGIEAEESAAAVTVVNIDCGDNDDFEANTEEEVKGQETIVHEAEQNKLKTLARRFEEIKKMANTLEEDRLRLQGLGPHYIGLRLEDRKARIKEREMVGERCVRLLEELDTFQLKRNSR